MNVTASICFPATARARSSSSSHGGYWQALDGSSFSHCARGLNAHGISVAVPTYDLCPAVSVGDIILQMQMAACELAKLGQHLVVSGHSAGGHLAACMLATDWTAVDASLPNNLVSAAYAISGLFDLPPLVGTSINTALRMDLASAEKASPLFWTPPTRGSLDAVVGGNESAEYFRQSRSIAETWGERIATRFAHRAGRQSFYGHRPAGRPQLTHGAALEGTGPRLITAGAGRFRPCAELF